MTSSDPDYLPKVPAPNTIILGIRAQQTSFDGTRFHPQQASSPALSSQTFVSTGDARGKGSEHQRVHTRLLPH